MSLDDEKEIIDTPEDNFDYEYYGDDFKDVKEPTDSEEDGSDTDKDKEVNDTDNQEDTDDSFELDGIDLSNVPKELRRDTLVDTIKAIEEDRLAKAQEKEDASKENELFKNLLKEQGYKDSFVAQYQKGIQELDEAISQKMQEAKIHLQNQIDAGNITESQANFEYGQYLKDLENYRENYRTSSYRDTNLAIVENFIKSNEDILKNEVLSKAAETLLTDVIQDGNIVDTERSISYLKIGKGLYDEGYKAGLAAAQNQNVDSDNEKLKQKLTNSQVKRGSSSAPKGSIPYTSISEVPQHVWNSNKKVRDHFLKQF